MGSEYKMWPSLSGRQFGKSRFLKELVEHRKGTIAKVTITYELLESNYACKPELELFKQTFPEGISVTSKEELVTIAKNFGKDFSVSWAAWNLLNTKYYDEYAKVSRLAGIECEKAQQQSYGECLKADQKAYNKYAKVSRLAGIECEKAQQQSYGECLKADQKAYNKYVKIKQPDRDKYREVQQQAYGDFLEDKHQALRGFKESLAIAVAKLYYEQESTRGENL